MNFLDRMFQPISMEPLLLGERLALVMLVAFVVGQLNAWCYRWTHRGVSYTRTFTQALVLISMVAALSMMLVVASPIAALGLLGGMAIIRFRTVVRDARDTTYVLLCLICGMAAGFGYYAIAVFGSLAANAVSFYLHYTGFGAWHTSDCLLRFEVGVSGLNSIEFESLLSSFCRRHSIISVDELPPMVSGQESVCQCDYKVRLRNPQRGPDLVRALKTRFGIDVVHLLVDRENEEVV